jgi:hypothetical protein
MTDIFDIVKTPPEVEEAIRCCNSDDGNIGDYHNTYASRSQSYENVERFSPEFEFNVEDVEERYRDEDEDEYYDEEENYRSDTVAVFNNLLSKYCGIKLTPETDSTVDVELKPEVAIKHEEALPFFEGIEKAIFMTDTFYRKIYVGESCGTHIHYSYSSSIKGDLNNARYIRYILNALNDWIEINTDRCTKIFGRGLGEYRHSFRLNLIEPMLSFSDLGHGNWINLSSNNKYGTIEFRLPKFRSAVQYNEAYNWGRKLVKTIYDLDNGSDLNPVKIVDSMLEDIYTSIDKINLLEGNNEILHIG